MKEYTVGTQITLTVPVGADHIVIIHEWNDIEVDYVAVSGTYHFTPTSIGIHIFYWINAYTNSVSNTMLQPNDPVQKPITLISGSTIKTTYSGPIGPIGYQTGTNAGTIVGQEIISVIVPLVTSNEFFNDFGELDTDNSEDDFRYVERLVRLFIERYTNEKFGPYINKILQIQGHNGNDLALEVPVRALRAITDSFGNDLSQFVQVSTTSPYFIHHTASVFFLDNSVDLGYVDRKRDVSYRGRKQFFTERLYFLVTGDFGYYWVPPDVTEAAKLIIADTFSGAQDMRRAGIQEAQLGDYRYQLAKSGDGTTGNQFADQLLSPYLNINLGLA